MYELDTVPGMVSIPPSGRAAIIAAGPTFPRSWKAGGGRSLLLTGHVDTVALGDNMWSNRPLARKSTMAGCTAWAPLT